MMGEVVQLPKRNVQHVSTEDLKKWWEAWDGTPDALLGDFDFESVYWELLRRGEPIEV